ncbi:hypothetical protein [Catenulispora rubra]|nr:hypothetical protein [Catenulispora rubra]
MSNDEITALLVLGPATVKTRVNRSTTRPDRHDRAQLVGGAYLSGLARP